VGHRDSSDPEPGAFYFLNRMLVGDLIIISYQNYTVSYKVKEIKTIDKDKLYKVSKEVFSLSGKPRLNLISCFGFYDKNNGGYQKNIIVVAEKLT
jgi:LPXTG-site transpeptidase (sortase) family protein